MRLSYKAIWGTVVISNLEFEIISVGKYWETFGRETMQGILFENCPMESFV